MGSGRNGIMSEPKKNEPDEDLLEFLGGIDEVNDESQNEDFSDFLAHGDFDRAAEPRKPKPKEPAKDDAHE
jgi:hypothetical protein